MQGNRYCLGVKTKDQIHTNLFTALPFDPNHGFVNQTAFPEGKQVVRSLGVNPKRDKVYTVASLNYEPLCVWEYDIASQNLRNVVPVREHPVYSQFITPVQASFAGPDRRKIDYYYLPPVALKPDTKYPALIDTYSDLGFQPNSQFLANAGIFYVTVNPYGRGFPQAPTTPEDTLAVYNEMLKNPNVDPHRIYLSGESLGTATIATLLTDHPDLWRGAILLSPTTFQAVSRDTKMVPSIFISFGDRDSKLTRNRVEQYAQEACVHHILMQILYGHAGHAFFDIGEHKKRYKAVATFILENR
jgi:dipeptidyl aminopeptidase/acylaminoacyl peptidase